MVIQIKCSRRESSLVKLNKDLDEVREQTCK